jgi:hypothetical protein
MMEQEWIRVSDKDETIFTKHLLLNLFFCGLAMVTKRSIWGVRSLLQYLGLTSTMCLLGLALT